MRKIDSVLNEKLKNSQQTPANNAQPKMSIKVSRARTTIMDSDYWTVETIRTKEGLGDISVSSRRMLPYGSPDRIYEIHVDHATVKTTIREYPDYLEVGWKPQFELGEGSSVAIAFNINWQLYRNKWRMVTDEKPYIFWVDDNNVLWGQLWDESLSRIQLATSVMKVKAIRGWKNTRYPDKDQGIVVAYIKTDGRVYYRNFCQQSNLAYIWEMERIISEFSNFAHSINLFITNDYRIGIVISEALGNTKVLIAERNWSGMAIEMEKIHASISEYNLNLLPVNYENTYMADTITASIKNYSIGLLWAGETAPIKAENMMIIDRMVGEEVGLGDGVQTEFQIYHQGFEETVYVDGIPVNNYVLTDKNLVFDSAPTGLITIDYTWENWAKQIKLTMAHGISQIDGSHSSFYVEDFNYSSFMATDISLGSYNTVKPSTYVGSNEIILLIGDFNQAANPLTIIYTSPGLKGEVGQEVAAFSISFDAINLAPLIIPAPEVEAIWNE